MANECYSAATITVATVVLFSMFCLHITEAEPTTKLGREKISELHFFFHDIVSGKNVTAVEVASAPTTESYFTQFGMVRVMDDWLTEGPEATSKMVGRAQGIYVSSCQQNVHLLMASTFVLQSGEYNGSTLAMVGKNAVFDEVREMPIVGGSGLFRLARGYALEKKSNPALFLQMGERGDRLKANHGMVSKSSANDLDSLNSKKKQSPVAKKISSPVSKLNGGSHKVPLDLKSSQKNHPDSAAMQALRNCEESNLDSNAVTIKSKEDIDVYVTEKHINDSTSQSEEISQPLKSDHSKTVEDKEQVEISPLDCNSGKRGQGSINSRDFATRDSTSSLPVLKLDRVQQSRDCHATTVEGLIDEEFEIAEVAEAASTPLTQVATSHSPNSRQLDMQPDRRNSFQAPSFKLQKRDLEEPTEATVVHNSSSDEPASNSFEFRLTSGNDIASEEISTPKVRIFEFGSPLATASDPPKSSPQLQNVPTLPPSASPVTDNGKSDSANSRKKWGNSESTAKGLRRLLMFGRKSRTSQAEKDVASSRGALVSV